MKLFLTCKVFPSRIFNPVNWLLDSRYGYSKERFVWSLISAVGIFCLGSGATIVDGVSNLWKAEVLILFYVFDDEF